MLSQVRTILLPLLVVVGLAYLTAWAVHRPSPRAESALSGGRQSAVGEAVAELNLALESLWAERSTARARSRPIPFLR